MRAAVIHVDNPFAPAARRIGAVRHRVSIARLAPSGGRPVIALLNGEPILRAHRGWQRRRLIDGDQLMFVTLPRGGGGGGNGGSNPLQVLLTVALFAFAGPLAGVLTGGLTAAATGMQGIIFAGTKWPFRWPDRR